MFSKTLLSYGKEVSLILALYNNDVLVMTRSGWGRVE